MLGGVFGVPSRHEQLAQYLRKLLVQNTIEGSSWSLYHTTDLIDGVRFLWLVLIFLLHIDAVVYCGVFICFVL